MPNPLDALQKAASIGRDPLGEQRTAIEALPRTEAVAPLTPGDLETAVMLSKRTKDLFTLLVERLGKGEALETIPRAVKEAALGLTKTVYHGTGHPEQALLPSTGLSKHSATKDFARLMEKPPGGGADFGVHVDPDPKVANYVSKHLAVEKYPLVGGDNPRDIYRLNARVIPLKARIENALDLPDMGVWKDPESFARMLPEGSYRLEPSHDIPVGPGKSIWRIVHGPIEERPAVIQELADAAEGLISRPLKGRFKTIAELAENANKEQAEWTRLLSTILKKHGYDAVRYLNTTEGVGNPSYMLLNSHQVRVPWAKMDPRKIAAGDLLASLAGVGVAGSGLSSLMSSHTPSKD